MSDIDRVFARLGGGGTTGGEQRELRRIPRRGGTGGARVVEVVRLPSRRAATPGDTPSPRPAAALSMRFPCPRR